MTDTAPHDPADHGRSTSPDLWGRASEGWLGQLRAAAVEEDPDAWLGELRTAAEEDQPVVVPPPRARPARRIGTTAALVVLFALGAAFTAAAGDRVAGEVADDESSLVASAPDASTTTDGTTDPATGTDATPAGGEPAPAETAAPPAVPPAEDAAPAPTPEPPAADPAPADTAANEGDALVRAPAAPTAAPAATPASVRHAARKAARRATAAPSPARRTRHQPAAQPLIAPVPARHRTHQLELENTPEAGATVWLHAVMPDPTPPSRRLTAAFAKQLRATARHEHVDWALLLGILRSRGELGSVPATARELESLASALAAANKQAAPVLAVTGDTATADRSVALAHLNRAVGLGALVHGFEWAKKPLGAKLLRDHRVTIYDGGRGDIEAGRIDVRVLALIGFLADTYGSVTVSCLESGHRLYARPGVISAHIYGLATDISAVGRTSILGHQNPGGITEETVRSILLLPAELRPRQVISLLGMGGPSFAQADHYNHIHVGF